MATPGFRVKLHSSLIMPLMLAGAPRRFTILNWTIGAAVVLGLQAFYALPVFIILHIVAVVLAKKDPYFFEVLLRSLRKRKYYDV
jgi:type IV secretion system protein VirB3